MHAGSAAAARYKSALDGMLTVLREEGIGGLYKGILSKVIQSVLTAAILFVSQRRIYELVKSVSVYFLYSGPTLYSIIYLSDLLTPDA